VRFFLPFAVHGPFVFAQHREFIERGGHDLRRHGADPVVHDDQKLNGFAQRNLVFFQQRLIGHFIQGQG